MKKTKLKLQRQTIAPLSAARLRQVAGGTALGGGIIGEAGTASQTQDQEVCNVQTTGGECPSIARAC